MKKNILLLVLVIILVLVFLGCNGEIITDESKVRNVIQEYFAAINEQDWDKAKNYCIYESNVYYETCDLEEHINDLIFQYGMVNFTLVIDIFDILIYDSNYAQSYIDGILNINYDSISDSSDETGYIYLEKIGSNWKIYDF